jgi:hypothetical protein
MDLGNQGAGDDIPYERPPSRDRGEIAGDSPC